MPPLNRVGGDIEQRLIIGSETYAMHLSRATGSLVDRAWASTARTPARTCSGDVISVY
jgi:hypothetical protein